MEANNRVQGRCMKHLLPLKTSNLRKYEMYVKLDNNLKKAQLGDSFFFNFFQFFSNNNALGLKSWDVKTSKKNNEGRSGQRVQHS